jgi:myo-inositol-1(or 4)-monophosphatase
MSTQPGREASGSSADLLADTDWLAICRRIVAAQRELFSEVRGSAARTAYEGVGEGGDWALVLDRRCEDVVFAELEHLAAEGAWFTAVSEERGEVQFGDDPATYVVIDPIDGSLNVRRTLPSHSLSVAVASGASMSDVDFAYVYDFGAGEEFVARRGEGSTVNADLLTGPPPPSDRPLEVVGLEAAKPALMSGLMAALADHVYRLRVVGSLAITLCYVAAGRMDGMLGLRPARSVDVAAAQLIAVEAGATVAFGGGGPADAGLGLNERYDVAAAWNDEGLKRLLEGQRQVSE